jgi:acid phosphatase
MGSRIGRVGLAALALLIVAAPAQAAKRKADPLRDVRRIVVIYEENHSFDNLYGGWEKVDGRRKADPAHTTQVDQSGAPLACLPQNDVNLAAVGTGCFANKPFRIDDYISPSDTTCPKPGTSAPNGALKGTGDPGGCTRDLVHRFYQEQYQLDGGRQNRYVTGSDAIGLTMGTYATRALPVYRYLHRRTHQRYAIADHFFQAAFGGSFLNHQWLVAARTPVWHGVPAGEHSILDSAGMPTTYPLYKPDRPVKDTAITQACDTPTTLAGVACGEWAVNTIQPTYQPHGSGAQLPPQTAPTIGDRLTKKGVSWAWYSGGWSNANGDVGAPGWTNGTTPGTCTDPDTASSAVYPNCPDKLFQYHHQPLNYYASFAPGTRQRQKSLRDEQEFFEKARASTSSCRLRKVSFIKPVGAENEHPGYASEHGGSDHLVSLLRAIHRSACRKRTMVVVTYDEFGGQWDHVPPPGQAGGPKGPHDEMGPGTRIPALIVSPLLGKRFAVDSASHDTTSVMATIEHRFHVRAVNGRDRKVRDLSTVFKTP